MSTMDTSIETGTQKQNQRPTQNTIEKLGNNEYKCPICGFRTEWKECLKGHMRVHNEPNPFGCPIEGCHYRAKRANSVKAHARTIHNINLPPETPLKNKSSLPLKKAWKNNTKVNAQSFSGMAFACTLCEFIGNSYSSALEHARQHKPFERKDDDNLLRL